MFHSLNKMEMYSSQQHILPNHFRYNFRHNLRRYKYDHEHKAHLHRYNNYSNCPTSHLPEYTTTKHKFHRTLPHTDNHLPLPLHTNFAWSRYKRYDYKLFGIYD